MDQRLPDVLGHLQEALTIANELGLVPDADGIDERNQLVLHRIGDLEPTKSSVISSVLSQASFFDGLVREQVSRAGIASGHLDFAERMEPLNEALSPLLHETPEIEPDAAWREAGKRFAEIERHYETIGAETLEEIEREHMVAEVYREFRAAVKDAETVTLELLETAFARYNTARQKVLEEETVAPGQSDEIPLADRLRQLQDEERRWGVARDVANRIVTAAGDADIVMGRLTQSTAGKERLYWQSQALIGSVSTLLQAFPRAFAAERSPDGRIESVKNLRMAIELFQERTRETAEEIEALAAEAADEIDELLAGSEQRLQRLTLPRS